MIAWLKGWTDWAFRPEGAEPLAFFRILVGLAIAVSIGSVLADGAVEFLWVDVAHGGYRSFTRVPWLVEQLGGPTLPVMTGLAMATVLASVVLMAGLGGRVTAFVLLQLYVAVDINTHAGGSYDLLIKNALWLCVLTPSTATWSVDAWIRRGRPWRGRDVPAWARGLVVFQLILMYWTTGLQKLSAHWTPGGEFDALYYILQQPSWQLYDLSFFAWLYPLTQVGTAVTWVWEITAPLWLLALIYRGTRERGGWLRATFNAWDVRTIYALIGVFFHGALVLTMNVGSFPMISLAFYVCLWDAQEWRAMGRGIRRRLSRAPKPVGAHTGTVEA